MRTQIAIVALSAVFSTAAFGQAAAAKPGQAMSSSSASGVQIQGNTELKAKQENSKATASGEGNTAKNTAGAIKGGTQIQGNTKIGASQKNSTAAASGKNNEAGNSAGTIGGK